MNPMSNEHPNPDPKADTPPPMVDRGARPTQMTALDREIIDMITGTDELQAIFESSDAPHTTQ